MDNFDLRKFLVENREKGIKETPEYFDHADTAKDFYLLSSARKKEVAKSIADTLLEAGILKGSKGQLMQNWITVKTLVGSELDNLLEEIKDNIYSSPLYRK